MASPEIVSLNSLLLWILVAITLVAVGVAMLHTELQKRNELLRRQLQKQEKK